ncbi:MAG: hypothetical protein ABSH50_03635 [Bryobacteraceae bacterium]
MRIGWPAAVIVIFLPASWAQKVPVVGGSGSGTVPGRTPPSMANGMGQPSAGMLNRDIYLSGKVMLDDGTPPTEPVVIERVCGGTPRAMAYTDTKGQFSFQIGHTSDVMQDASEEDSGGAGSSRQGTGAGAGMQPAAQYNVPDSRLENCDLRAVLAGFRSDIVSLGARRLLDDPNVGTIVLRRLSAGAGTVVSVTTLQAPKDARKAYDKGLQAVQQGRRGDAAKLFQKAADLYPKFAAAWCELGKVQQQNQEMEAARQSYTRAMEADAKFLGPYEQLTELALNSSNWSELADWSQGLLELDPDGHPAAYLYNAMANLKLERFEAAEKSARAGEKADAEHRYPKREQVLAMILAHKKDYAGAAEHMHLYLLYAPRAEDAGRMRVQLAEYERLSGANQEAKATGEKRRPRDAGGVIGNPGPP